MLGMWVLRIAVALAWAYMLIAAGLATNAMGIGPAMTLFGDDMAHPWRRVMNSDLLIHLVLVAAWVFWRSRTIVVGFVAAVLTIFLGGLFTLPYIFAASFSGRGEVRALLLGARSGPTARG